MAHESRYKYVMIRTFTYLDIKKVPGDDKIVSVSHEICHMFDNVIERMDGNEKYSERFEKKIKKYFCSKVMRFLLF